MADTSNEVQTSGCSDFLLLPRIYERRDPETDSDGTVTPRSATPLPRARVLFSSNSSTLAHSTTLSEQSDPATRTFDWFPSEAARNQSYSLAFEAAATERIKGTPDGEKGHTVLPEAYRQPVLDHISSVISAIQDLVLDGRPEIDKDHIFSAKATSFKATSKSGDYDLTIESTVDDKHDVEHERERLPNVVLHIDIWTPDSENDAAFGDEDNERQETGFGEQQEDDYEIDIDIDVEGAEGAEDE